MPSKPDRTEVNSFLYELFPSTHQMKRRNAFAELGGGKRSRKDLVEDAFNRLKDNADVAVQTDDHPIRIEISGLETVSEDEEDELDSEYEDDDSLNDDAKTEAVMKLLTLLGLKGSASTVSYFRESLDTESQEVVLGQISALKKISCGADFKKPYTMRVLGLPIDDILKSHVFEKALLLENLDDGSVEHHKLKSWLQTFLRIPFGKLKDFPVSLAKDGSEVCRDYLQNSLACLNKITYGMDNAKLQIMQLLCQWVSNPAATGSAISLHGPMGTGKTTLIKDGVRNVLGRDFVFVPLGGATDSSFLDGHSYTYEGSTYGRIIQGLRDCGTMNPIFFFDELDKVSDTPKGQEIIGVLTHLTDPSQNDMFFDKYFADVSVDLSRALFFFSYNDESKISPILLDRMYKIKTKGYTSLEKKEICKRFLIPKILSKVGISSEELTFSEDAITAAIENSKEEGVRCLKRSLETVVSKLNLVRLMGVDNCSVKLKPSEANFPLTVTAQMVKTLTESKPNEAWKSLYI